MSVASPARLPVRQPERTAPLLLLPALGLQLAPMRDWLPRLSARLLLQTLAQLRTPACNEGYKRVMVGARIQKGRRDPGHDLCSCRQNTTSNHTTHPETGGLRLCAATQISPRTDATCTRDIAVPRVPKERVVAFAELPLLLAAAEHQHSEAPVEHGMRIQTVQADGRKRTAQLYGPGGVQSMHIPATSTDSH